MKRFDANVSSFQSTLQKRPKILQAVRVNVFADVFNCVIDALMHVFQRGQSVVRIQTVCVDPRPFRNVSLRSPLAVRDDQRWELPGAYLASLTVNQTEHRGLLCGAS